MLDSVFLHRRFGRLNAELTEFIHDTWDTQPPESGLIRGTSAGMDGT